MEGSGSSPFQTGDDSTTNLLASLASARDGMAKLDLANRDLIAALEDKNDEIDRLSNEGSNLQGRYRQLSSQLHQAERLIDEQSQTIQTLQEVSAMHSLSIHPTRII